MKKWRGNMHSTVTAATATRGALTLALLSAVLLAVGAQRALAQTETVLYRFQGSPDGANPFGGTPVMDKEGNLYGTTEAGGTYNLGTVWKVTPSGTETVLWSFGNGTDGAVPLDLAMDKKGNLFGTTYQGGAYKLGTAFEVTPAGTETILWNFGNGTDGSSPDEMVLDNKGNIFGVTTAGGAYDIGTVYEITSSGKETILWNFGANVDDQPDPRGIMLAKNGNLYGTTYGPMFLPKKTPYSSAYGTVWELTQSGTETVLHIFHADGGGALPTANVVMDNAGNLYGPCHFGGFYGNGTVFKLTPSGPYALAPSGTYKVIHVFRKVQPYNNTTLYKGDLYSTTAGGLPGPKGGTVWKMTRSGKQTILHKFPYNKGTDGFESLTGVVLDGRGNVYGTTFYGGGTACQSDGETMGCGVVFKVTP